MYKNIKIITGVLALVMAIGLNVRHAINNYGIKDSKFHIEAQARTVDGWAIGFITGWHDAGSVRIKCCVPGEPTDACNYEVVGCIEKVKDDDPE